MKIIGKPKTRTLIDVWQSLNPTDINEILIATAYVNKKGFNFIKDLIKKVKTKIVLCLDPSVTDWQPLEDIIKIGSVECRYYKPTAERYFHPKMYIIKYKNGKHSIILGSSNLTHGGMKDNIEANMYFEGLSYSDAKDFLDYFSEIFSKADPLNMNAVNKFREIRDKYIDNHRKWQGKIQRTKAKIFTPPPTTLLTSEQTKKVIKILKRERGKYIDWFKKKNHCKDRKRHIDNIKNYASHRDWVKLFDNVWSVGGLRRGALARSSVFVSRYGRKAFRTRHEVSVCLADINKSLIRNWINHIQRKDWGNASMLHLHGIGDKIQSELFCIYHGDEYGIKNDKSIRAFKYLLGDPKTNFSYSSYDTMPYSYFNQLLNDLKELYLEVIGRQCGSISTLLELDAFFWYLYGKREELKGYE